MSSPPRTISEWWIFQFFTDLPFSLTDFTYLFFLESPFAVIVNILPFALFSNEIPNLGDDF